MVRNKRGVPVKILENPYGMDIFNKEVLYGTDEEQ